MKIAKTISIIIAAALLLGGTTAMADDDEKKNTGYEDVTEYTFNDDLVTGDLIRPNETGILVVKRGQTRSLIKVRGHFVPQMLRSVEDI